MDHSLLFRRNDKVIAVLPANEVEGTLESHGGLTYGGLITGNKWSAEMALQCMDALLEYLKQVGISKLLYKPMPYIYGSGASEEDLYALMRVGGVLTARTLSSCVTLSEGLRLSRGKKSGLKNAQSHGLTISESTDLEGFYQILKSQLNADYQKDPVHTLAEIQKLQKTFPRNIRLFTVHAEERLLAGSLIYETPTVAHAQYITSNAEGREKHALDLLFASLLKDVYAEKSIFDFGISTEEQGSVLNAGLIQFKEGFGAHGVCYDTYEVEV